MPRRVARGDQHIDPGDDLVVALAQLVARVLEVHPLRDCVALRMGSLVLSLLRVNRALWKQRVATAVVEVEMRVHDRGDVVSMDAGSASASRSGRRTRLIQPLDGRTIPADAGLEQDDASAMADRERKHRALLAAERMARGEMDVVGMNRMTSSV